MAKYTANKVFRFIRRQLDKIPASPGLIKRGNWYVRYNDGARSANLTYDVCKDYAEIFGGNVFHKTDIEINAAIAAEGAGVEGK